MIRAFALGLCVGALLHWLAGRSSSLALPPQRGNGWQRALRDPTFRRALDAGLADAEAGRTVPWETVVADDPYLADLAAILERERW